MRTKQIEDFDELREAIRANGMRALDEVYLSFKDDFRLFARRYTQNDEDIADVYQDTMIAFFEQISKPGMKQVSCSVKTYLFSIGKYKIINFSRRKGRTISMVNEDLDLQLVEWEESRADLSDEQMRILGLLDHIGSKCKELLVLFYYHGFRIEAIKREMNYASENAVKVTKSNCMKKLRSLVTKKQL